ncbi:MAG: M16 family metallopeptidase [Steroidobacteraceae bacterium]
MRPSQYLRSLSTLAAVLAVAGCSHAAFQSSRTDSVTPAATQTSELTSEPLATPPAPLPLEPIEFPPFHERTLANGARVIVVPNREQPVVSVSVAFRGGGSAADPQDKAGVAELTADLMTKGTATRNAQEIAETIAFVGGQLSVTAGEDWTILRTTVLTDFADTALSVLADVLAQPKFPAAELESTRKRMLSALQVSYGEPTVLAERRFRQELYGQHPYGRTTTPASLAAITREDDVGFYERFYRPSQSLIIVAGDVEPASIVARLDRAFAKWSPGDSPARHVATLATLPAPAKRRLVIVHKPGSVQAVYRVGHLLPAASSADWVEIGVLRAILSDRLMDVLREQKGYTYSAYAIAAEQQQAGHWAVNTEVRTEEAHNALAEMLRIMEQLRSGPVQADALANMKSALTGVFPIMTETPQQVGDTLMTTLLLGRPVEYLESFRTQVAATTTTADIERVAHEYLHPDRLVIVVVGDATQLLEKLRPFADSVELYDVNGQPLAAESLTTAAQPQ